MKSGRICVIVLFMAMFASFAHALEPIDETQLGGPGTITTGHETKRGGSETITTGLDIEDPALALAPPTATVTLDPSSNCSDGLLQVAITSPISMTRYYWRAVTSTGVLLGEDEQSYDAGTSYTGSFGFPFSSTVPDGTIVELYGYMGQTPPKAKNTPEFSITYRCDTGTVLASCAGPYGPCASAPAFPALDGRWFKLSAAVNGQYVQKANGVIKPHNFTVPLYMGFAWDTVNSRYDVNVFTKTAPDVWTRTLVTTKSNQTYTQNFLPDFYLKLFVNNNTDYLQIWHTPRLKYVLDNTGALKAATYSGIGEVFGGSFDTGTSDYFGSVKITGSMVSVSKLPFTP